MMPGRNATLLSSLVLGVCLLGTSGCFFTSIGMSDPTARAKTDFGPPETLRVCALLDDGITQQDARETLQDYWNQNEASEYDLSVKLVSYSTLPRSLDKFFYWQIADEVAMRQIPKGCDRMMYFVNRNALDALWSVPELYGAPEVLGEVDNYTMTRGFVVDRIASLNQLLMGLWLSPSKVARHETYHMLGCQHSLEMDQCYKRIAEAKWIENRLSSAGCYEKSGIGSFFPAFSHEGEGPLLLTRAQANSVLGLEKDPSFTSFVKCARDAGLPLETNGIMQLAWAKDWMNEQVQEAHSETARPVIASASPVGRVFHSVAAASPATSPSAPAAQSPDASESNVQSVVSPGRQTVSGPTASASRATTLTVPPTALASVGSP
jgi:hypothetical protein